MGSVILETAHQSARALRRVLQLSPMCVVFREMRRRGIAIEECDVLECFAFTGAMHTLDYSRKVRSLEVWEINPNHEKTLRKHFPDAEVRMTDTYEEIIRRDRTFNVIVVDNSPVHEPHVEHYDIFPALFRLMQDTCTVILNVMPDLHTAIRQSYPEMLLEPVLRSRAAFYKVRDPLRIAERDLIAPYAAFATGEGFTLRWHFLRKRNPLLVYLVMHFVRGH